MNRMKHPFIKNLFFLLLLYTLMSACTSKPPEDMVLIPAGPFIMGTDEVDVDLKASQFGILKPWFEDEQPAHTVTLKDYFMDQYEVTNAAYQKFAQAAQHRPPPYWSGTQYTEEMDRYPVVMVSWLDAQAYCQWAGKRLPTEAEWEKSARPDGRRHPWGATFDPDKANVGGLRGGLTPGGNYEDGQSPYGVFDLIGNVWEWTADWYQPYPGNPKSAKNYGEKNKVLRGGSWSQVGHFPPQIVQEIISHNARAAFRLYADPKGLLNDIGFRCAKSS